MPECASKLMSNLVISFLHTCKLTMRIFANPIIKWKFAFQFFRSLFFNSDNNSKKLLVKTFKSNGEINDVDRLDYYNSHLNAVHNATEQGVRIDGYFAWSLMDNFEWAEGYLKRFGIVYVDYSTQQRTIKNSGLAYKALISNR